MSVGLVNVSEGSNFIAPENKSGYIQPKKLKELWVHTGLRCNLSCPFCFEGAGPLSTRIEQIGLDDFLPFMNEAVELGVEQLSFTGGEPFFNPEFINILEVALEQKPCLVLTNATEPLKKHLPEIELLRYKPYPLSFRVSLDYPDAFKHDANRGQGHFRLSMENIKHLHKFGFKVSIARHQNPQEDSLEIQQKFQEIFQSENLPKNIHIASFPDLLPPMSRPTVPTITEHCMTTYKTEVQRDSFMCSNSAMIAKKKKKICIYPCTLVDDDDSFSYNGTLADAFSQRVLLKHHRCFACFSMGTSCSEL